MLERIAGARSPRCLRSPRASAASRCVRALRAPAATFRRACSPTTTSHDGRRPPTSGSARAPASAQRHIAADARDDLRPCARRLRARRSPQPRLEPADIDLIIVATTTPDMIFPSTRLHPAGEARLQGRRRVRRPGRLLGIRLRALARRPDGRAPATHATRWSSAPRSTRASSTGTTAAPACCSATARARWCSRPSLEPGILAVAPARRRPHTPTSCACRVRSAAARSPARLRARWTAAHVFKLAVKVLADAAQETLAAAGLGARRDRLADPAPGQPAHHRRDGEEARHAARKRSWSRSIVTPTRRRPRSRSRSTRPCATAASGRDTRAARRASAAASPGARFSCAGIHEVNDR